MSEVLARVFYHSFATEDVYAIVREAAGPHFEVLALDTDDDEERFQKIAQCEAVICAATPLKKCHLDAATRLRIVHHQGVGWQDTTDWQEIKRRGLPLGLTPEGTTIGVAEHTILLMLAAAKRLSFADRELRGGHWHVNTLRGVSRELFGKTIGYVGLGRIGLAVAERLKAFGCSGIYADPVVRLDKHQADALGVRAGSLDEVLAAADVLTVHVPLTIETHHMIGASEFTKLRPGAIVVNTARGGIVDEQALADALRSGHVLAAGIDVFEEEPAKPTNPLLGLDNVVVTPHISAGTRDAMRQKMAALFSNLRSFFKGGDLRNRVTFP
ncbi:MAG: 2-hydroxyacid dehydrogenase [Hyphomicrobiaceae bacterium]